MNFLAVIGRVTIATLAEIGKLSKFTWAAVSHVVRPPFFLRMLLLQMLRIG